MRNQLKAQRMKTVMQNRSWFWIQSALFLSILFLPLRFELHLLSSIKYLGLFFLVIGVILLVSTFISLKGNLKPSLKPRVGGYLVTTGLYRIVRHPAYSCILLIALGISLWMDDAMRLLLTLGLFILFNAKSLAEERWLEKTYPEYDDYKKRVTKKLVPWIF